MPQITYYIVPNKYSYKEMLFCLQNNWEIEGMAEKKIYLKQHLKSDDSKTLKLREDMAVSLSKWPKFVTVSDNLYNRIINHYL